MKHKNDASRRNPQGTERIPCFTVGAGRVSATGWKTGDASRGWGYHFTVFSVCPDSGQVEQRFTPDDLVDLVRLASTLATVIALDGCVSDGQQQELLRLAAFVDEVSGDSRLGRWRVMPMDGELACALRTIVDSLWDDERRDHEASPSENHLFTCLQIVDEWLEGRGEKPRTAASRPTDETLQ